MQESQQELQGELYFYRLLSQIFSIEPSAELLQQIGGIEPLDSTDDVSRGIRQMVDSVKRNAGRIEEYQEELSVEFARLFLGPIRPVAIPYASYYLSESRLLNTEETLEVRRKYLESGMAIKELFRVPDDHIGIELEFLCYLTSEIFCAHEAGGGQGRVSALETARDEFVHGHFLRWVPAFADRLVADPWGDEFFKGAALLLKGVVATFSEASQENHDG